VESVSGYAAGGGGGMTLLPTQKDRVHNFRIVGTISNDTEGLDWEPLESKLLAAAAYIAPRRTLYLRFNSGEVYQYFTFSADQYQEFLAAESKGRHFLRHIRGCFPYQRLPRR
jgi:KTSC domain